MFINLGGIAIIVEIFNMQLLKLALDLPNRASRGRARTLVPTPQVIIDEDIEPQGDETPSPIKQA